jgi:hypothetical protein
MDHRGRDTHCGVWNRLRMVTPLDRAGHEGKRKSQALAPASPFRLASRDDEGPLLDLSWQNRDKSLRGDDSLPHLYRYLATIAHHGRLTSSHQQEVLLTAGTPDEPLNNCTWAGQGVAHGILTIPGGLNLCFWPMAHMGIYSLLSIPDVTSEECRRWCPSKGDSRIPQKCNISAIASRKCGSSSMEGIHSRSVAGLTR